jgi:RNA polymerase sigma factor (sigma-70 family)
MHSAVEFKHFEPNEGLRELVGKLISRLDRKSKRLASGPIFLRLAIEEIPAHNRYRISLTLEAPGKTLAANEETHDPEAGVRAALSELERQMETYKDRLRGEHFWKRLVRRDELLRKKKNAPPETPSGHEAFFALVRPHLEKLNHFVGHVLAFAESRGDLAPGELAPEDVVDATLLRAYDEFVKDHARGSIRSWLIRLAIKQLKGEIQRSKAESKRTVSIERDVPETPPAQEVSTLGDEILDFYQPDEDLKVEDVVPDLEVPTPEEETEAAELRRCVKGALAAMPGRWRRALLLRYVQELRGPELAEILGMTEAAADAIVENAREALRQELIAAGCGVKGNGQRPGIPGDTGALAAMSGQLPPRS